MGKKKKKKEGNYYISANDEKFTFFKLDDHVTSRRYDGRRSVEHNHRDKEYKNKRQITAHITYCMNAC